MYMGVGMDTGDIIYTSETQVGETETAGELFDRLAILGGELLCRTLSDVFAGTAPRTVQNEKEASYAPPLGKDMCPIDWNTSVSDILNKIRGLNPWPVATAELDGKTFKVFAAKTGKNAGNAPAGTIIDAGKDGITVACLDGAVTITELQAPGGKRMKAADYLRGHPICL